MSKQFRVHETIEVVHFIEAESVEKAREIAKRGRPFHPDPSWDTEILSAGPRLIEEYDPEG